MAQIARVDAALHFNHNHINFFKCDDRNVLVYGSAGAGKSYTIADKLLIQIVTQPKKLKILVIRKTLPSLKRTCIPLLEQRANLYKIPYKLHGTDYIAKVGDYESEIHFVSMNHKVDYEKVKSITDLDLVWIEEANEITEDAWDLIKLRPRGGQGNFKQLILSFNPVSIASWIYDLFWVRGEQAAKFKYTVYDNPFIEQEYIDVLENLKNTNYNLYKVYCLGEWGILKGIIYDNIEIVDLYPSYVDETIYGLDFGFNNPSALVKIDMADGTIYVEELLYETGLTNTKLIQRLKSLKISTVDPIYCDNAEPARIKEISDAGFNALPANKEVSDGIDFCKSMEINFMSESTNLIKEGRSYSWAEDKDGKPLDEPVKFMDHCMDSMRYALYTHLKHQTVARIREI